MIEFTADNSTQFQALDKKAGLETPRLLYVKRHG